VIIPRLRHCANESQRVCAAIGLEPRFLVFGVGRWTFVDAVREAMALGIIQSEKLALEQGKLMITEDGRCPLVLVAEPSAELETEYGWGDLDG